MIKVLIVEDQQILLDTFTSAMRNYDDIRVVAAIADAGASDLACRTWHPDCVLMDICADGDILGIYATERIKKENPAIKVILMTGFPELNFLERGKEAGADSFLYKTSSMEEFVECIRATMAGEHRYPNVSRDTMTFGTAQCALTERELEILRLYSAGLTRREMAKELFVSDSTINFHINKMLAKTGFKTLLQLAIEAANKGYINVKS